MGAHNSPTPRWLSADELPLARSALWPLTYINTEAIRLIDPESQSRTRHPSIMADAAFAMLSRPGSSYTGNFEIDELLLRCSVG